MQDVTSLPQTTVVAPTQTDWQFVLKRVKQLLLTPKLAWVEIAKEPGGWKELLWPYGVGVAVCWGIGYSVMMALIGLWSSLMGSFLGGMMGAMWTLKNLASTLVNGAFIVVGGLVVDITIARVLAWLAPHVGGQADWLGAGRVLIYSATPVAVAALLVWIPVLGQLLLLLAAIRACYLMYLGFNELLRCKSILGRLLLLLVAGIMTQVFFFAIGTLSSAVAPKRPMSTDATASQILAKELQDEIGKIRSEAAESASEITKSADEPVGLSQE